MTGKRKGNLSESRMWNVKSFSLLSLCVDIYKFRLCMFLSIDNLGYIHVVYYVVNKLTTCHHAFQTGKKVYSYIPCWFFNGSIQIDFILTKFKESSHALEKKFCWLCKSLFTGKVLNYRVSSTSQKKWHVLNKWKRIVKIHLPTL